MIWESPHLLWFLLVIPIFIAMQWWYKKRQIKKREQFFEASLFEKLQRGFWPTGNRIKMSCLYAGLAFLIVAAAGPKIGTEVREVEQQGVELLIALDLSASMNAEDVQPSRLAKAKYEISRLIERLQGDRLGLIVFTGSAYLQVPLTLDYAALRMFLDIAETDQMPNSATNFKVAMEMAAEVFKSENQQADESTASEVLFIISDGENHGDDYGEALQELVEIGVKVYTLGIGTLAGGTIPIFSDETSALLGYKRSDQGMIITTALMPQVLKNIAQQGDGEYYQIGVTNTGIDAFLAELENLQQGEFASQKFADYQNQYQWLAAVGLAFLIVSMVSSDYKRK